MVWDPADSKGSTQLPLGLNTDASSLAPGPVVPDPNLASTRLNTALILGLSRPYRSRCQTCRLANQYFTVQNMAGISLSHFQVRALSGDPPLFR